MTVSLWLDANWMIAIFRLQAKVNFFYAKKCSSGIRSNRRSRNECRTIANLVRRAGFISFRSSCELLLINRFSAASVNLW